MRPTALFLSIAMLAVPVAIAAQSFSTSQNLVADGSDSGANPGANPSSGSVQIAPPAGRGIGGPLSRVALGGGVSLFGVNLMAATNLNRYMNLRATGSEFKYADNGISTNGFNLDADLNLASAGASVDIYPFPRHGLRFSPGVLFYNQNKATATFTVQPGTSFTLNNYTYYASSSNPVTGAGGLGLNSQKPAFTITTGWGNMISRRGGHFSIPFELGVAFIGAPSLNIALTSGQVCDAQGQNCVNVATDADVQSNLQQQIAKYKSDLDPLKTFPIISVGVAYAFRIR
ncbi:MAG: hypothetical protein ACRD3N_01385 [Terracidiphilus sp.]